MKGWLLDRSDRWNDYEYNRFLEQAKNERIDICLYDPKDFEIQISTTGDRELSIRGRKTGLPDFVFARIGASADYYDMALIRHLEYLRVTLVNSSTAISIARDKLQTIEMLVHHGLPVPKTMLAKFPPDFEMIAAEFRFPLIVKPIAGSRGKGVILCKTYGEMQDLMEMLDLSKKQDANYIIQEFVSDSNGKDIRVIVVGGRAIGAMMRQSQDGRYKANISRGGLAKPFALNAELERLSKKATSIVGLEISGVDILFDGEGYKICELNSGPGFQGFEKATGLNVPQLIYEYIQARVAGYHAATAVLYDVQYNDANGPKLHSFDVS